MLRWLIILLLSCAACPVWAFLFQMDSMEMSELSVDVRQISGPVNRKVFGHLIKGADNYGIFSTSIPDQSILQEGKGIWNPDTQSPYTNMLGILEGYRAGTLRYPGGLALQRHNWKDTVGPLEERGDWKFGLYEFMQVCETVGAEPIIGVSEYIGDEQDAADLVAYLNLPVESGNSWALMRSAQGHVEPYGVTQFEIGNESWVDWRQYGDYEGPRTAEEAGVYASSVAAAMKAVDPAVRCGVPIPGEGVWGERLLAHIDTNIDFVVIHTYPVKYLGGDMDDEEDENLLLDTMMTAGYDTSFKLQEWRDMIQSETGRDLPVAITEHNMGPTQSGQGGGRPYRFSMAAALANGDYIGRMLSSENGVECASHFNWLNGYFASVVTYATNPVVSLEKLDEPVLRPMHYMSTLWGAFQGDDLVEISGSLPSEDFGGYLGVNPCGGDVEIEASRISSTNILDGADKGRFDDETVGVDLSISNAVWTFDFDEVSGDGSYDMMLAPLSSFPASMRPPTERLVYRLTFDARWVPAAGSSVPMFSLAMFDNRGAVTTGSAVDVRGLQDSTNWLSMVCQDYRPLDDTGGLFVRLLLDQGGSGAVSGQLQLQNLKVEAWSCAVRPARPRLSAYATLSEDRKQLWMTVFNLTREEDILAEINLTDFLPDSVCYSEVNAPSAVTTDANLVGWTYENEPSTLSSSSTWEHRFPAHSATGILFERDDSVISDAFDRTNTPYSADASAIGCCWTNAGSTAWRINDETLQLGICATVESVMLNQYLETQSSADTNFCLKGQLQVNGDSKWVGMVFHYQDSENFYTLRFKSGTTLWQLVRRVSGATSVVSSGNASSVLTSGGSYDFQIESTGEYTFDLQVAATDTGDSMMSVAGLEDTESSHSSGYAGFISFSGSATEPLLIADDFELEVIVP